MAWKRRSKSKVKNAKKSSYKGLDFKSNLELKTRDACTNYYYTDHTRSREWYRQNWYSD